MNWNLKIYHESQLITFDSPVVVSVQFGILVHIVQKEKENKMMVKQIMKR